jgi:PHP family Zn ribbon phosphoesterase
VQISRRFQLTARCNQCGYKITKEVVSDLANLTAVKSQFAKEVSTIHKQHPELANFDVTYKVL